MSKEIKRLMQKKKQADEHLVELEARIYQLETEYFRETGNYGSLMTGLEGYLGLIAGTGQTGGMRRSTYREVKDSARIFSNASASSRRAVSLFSKFANNSSASRVEYDEDSDDDDEDLADEDEVLPSSSNKRIKSSQSTPLNKNRKRK